jgi:hypothetical protein
MKNKKINSKFYKKINLNSNPPKELTKEEFLNREAGMVWFDNSTGKLIFKKTEQEILKERAKERLNNF